MDKDDLIFLLGTIVVFLVGIIVFSATFTIPIKSGVLQYLSGGAIIVSSIFLVAQIWKYLKKKDRRLYRRIRYRGIMGRTMNLPGKGGRKVSEMGYKITQKFFGFN